MEFVIVSHYITFLCVIQYSESFNWTVQPANPTLVTSGEDMSLTWEFTLTADEQTKSQTFYLIKWKMFNPSSSDYDLIGAKYFLRANGRLSYVESRAPHIEIDKNDPATLLINNVRTEDEGTYKIEYSVWVDGTVLADHEVNVSVLEHPDIVNTSGNQDVCEGSMVTLSCNATGKPTPNITWTRVWENSTDSGELPSSDGFYVIRNIDRSSSGTYRCTASSGVGNPVNQTMEVIVGIPAAMERIQNVTIKEGKNVSMECKVTKGSPPLTVFWENVKSGQVIMGKLLNINHITRYQTEYRCIANNTCGRDSSTMFIDVQYKPSATRSSSTIELELGEDRSIGCPVDIGNPPAVITWYKGNDTSGKKVTNCSTLEVQNVALRNKGWYTCFAKNELGNTTVNLLLMVVKPASSTVATLSQTTPTGAVGKRRSYEDDRGVYDNGIGLDDIEPSQPDSREDAQPPAEYMDLLEAGKNGRKAESAAPVPDYAHLHPSTRSWEVLRHHVTIEKEIGKGAFGQVAKGTAVGLRGRRETTAVAIKMLKSNAIESDKSDLMNELETMKQLEPHPHVIKLLGCVTESEPLLVLIEYVPFGDLLGYLRKSRGLKDTYYKDPDIKPQTNLTSQQLMKFAWQIADGMSYLSSKSIIHRDLAARNVLVGQKETCKVTDFGMARDVQQENIYERKTKGRLPVKWTAYEALLYGKYTTKSDVWSYGVLLYEIFTIGGSPYPRMDGKKIANLLQDGYRMPKPQHVDEKLYQIMMKCWKNDPDARPTFTKLKTQLKDMETLHKKMINMTMYDKQLYANVEDLTV